MNYTVKPEKHELEEARSIVDQVVSTAEAFQEKEQPITFGLSWDRKIEPVTTSSQKVIIRFNTDEDDWEQEMRGAVARGYAQAWFLEHTQPELHWQELLMLGHSLHFSERATGSEAQISSKKELAGFWPEIKDNLSLSKQEVNHELMRHGFSLSYHLIEEILEKHEMEDLPELSRSEVIEAGDRIFG
jgi:hypothetical protein